MKISSKKFTTVHDANKNKFKFEDGFLFETIKEIISSKKTSIIDIDNNKYFFENSKVDLKNNEIIGKEVKVDFIDNFFGIEKNDPILKGKSTTSNNNQTKIYKSVFSTCNIENKNCRGWELQSENLFIIKKNYLNIKIY